MGTVRGGAESARAETATAAAALRERDGPRLDRESTPMHLAGDCRRAGNC